MSTPEPPSPDSRPSTDSAPSTPAPTVVLVRPREEGNVGAAARAMANMGLSSLRLVEPAAELGDTARMFAVGARSILDSAERFDSLAVALAPFRRAVGTTSARDRMLGVPVTTARELPAALAADPPGPSGEPLPTALVFGSEVGGLTNDELALCHRVVTIPCSTTQPTLNLAQAVLLVAYELWTATGAEPLATVEVDPPARSGVVDGLFSHLDAVLQEVGFARDSSYDGVVQDLRRLAARSGLTEREVTVLRGMLRRTQRALERRDS